MDHVGEIIKNAVSKRISEGMFFKDGIREMKCSECGERVGTRQAKCWGQEVDGFFMFDWHDHVSHIPAVRESYGLSTKIRRGADFVVVVYGRPCYITEMEKEKYLDALMRGNKIVEIRGYVFDRVYPIMPYEDWVDEEQRRNRRVEAVHFIED